MFCSRDRCGMLASLFVMAIIGTEASLAANTPDYHSHTLPLVFRVEVLASALLMAVIYLVYTKGLQGLGGLAIGGIVGLDIFFLSSSLVHP